MAIKKKKRNNTLTHTVTWRNLEVKGNRNEGTNTAQYTYSDHILRDR